jgi:hypothetical protein
MKKLGHVIADVYYATIKLMLFTMGLVILMLFLTLIAINVYVKPKLKHYRTRLHNLTKWAIRYIKPPH